MFQHLGHLMKRDNKPSKLFAFLMWWKRFPLCLRCFIFIVYLMPHQWRGKDHSILLLCLQSKNTSDETSCGNVEMIHKITSAAFYLKIFPRLYWEKQNTFPGKLSKSPSSYNLSLSALAKCFPWETTQEKPFPNMRKYIILYARNKYFQTLEITFKKYFLYTIKLIHWLKQHI